MIVLLGTVAAKKASDDIEDTIEDTSDFSEEMLHEYLSMLSDAVQFGDFEFLSAGTPPAMPTPGQLGALRNLLRAANKGHYADATSLGAVGQVGEVRAASGQAAGGAAGLEKLKKLGQMAAMAGKHAGAQAAGGAAIGRLSQLLKAKKQAGGQGTAGTAWATGFLTKAMQSAAKSGASGAPTVKEVADQLSQMKAWLDTSYMNPQEETVKKMLDAPGGPEKLASLALAMKAIAQGYRTSGPKFPATEEGALAVKKLIGCFKMLATK